MGNYLKHVRTILKHKYHVMIACFKVGLIRQGLLHDLSKFLPIEFMTSVKYYKGTSSPIAAEKEALGYSLAWQHHKGRNKHHWHYWTDFGGGKLWALQIPPKYLSEMICDWVGAGKAYNKDWTIETFKKWYELSKDRIVINQHSRILIENIMEKAQTEEDIYEMAKVENLSREYKLIDGECKPTKFRVSMLVE